VVVLRNIAPASTNPFAEISRRIGAELNLGNVSRPFSSVEISVSSNVTTMRVILLPYQILIFPRHYISNGMIKIDKSSNFQVIHTQDLR
jgi:hypothetical protein